MFNDSREIKLIEIDKYGFVKTIRVRVENINKLKRLLCITDEAYENGDDYVWNLGGYVVNDLNGAIKIITKMFVQCEIIYTKEGNY